MARSLRRRRSGRVLIGVRDNGRAVQAFGVNLARSRLAAFGVSGLMAGMAGGLLAYLTPAFADNAFPPERSIELFTLAVIGGIGSLPGAILGAAFVVGIPLLPGLRDINQIQLLTMDGKLKMGFRDDTGAEVAIPVDTSTAVNSNVNSACACAVTLVVSSSPHSVQGVAQLRFAEPESIGGQDSPVQQESPPCARSIDV